MNIGLSRDNAYQSLLDRISEVYTSGQGRALQSVNNVITETYWQIGHDIVEFEQGGKIRADYGKALLSTLSRDLTLRHGKGFSRSNLINMRLLLEKWSVPDLQRQNNRRSFFAWPQEKTRKIF